MSDFEVEYGNELKHPYQFLVCRNRNPIAPELVHTSVSNDYEIGVHLARYIYNNCPFSFAQGLE